MAASNAAPRWRVRLKLERPKPETPSKGRPAAMGWEGAKRLRGDFMIVSWSAAG
ncbi:hypothetical protein CTTA_1432 [Comamonas testosteroni]|uniref:Uncharacterized protein n=1 Tax=Comamonas testosteroni TaxID=285 RepID=A0A5A7M9C2_COMTE|nr:hypothetical protein CTTA_1432 [Comamonas testosteroni]